MKLKIIRKKSNVNKQSKKSSSMAKGKKSKSKKSSNGSKGGLFSGKVLGFKVPLVDKVIKNKTLQKAMVATGAVTTIGAIVSLVNNPTVNKVWSNPLAKDATALATGDITGAIARRVIENPGLVSQVTGRGAQTQQTQFTSQAGFA